MQNKKKRKFTLCMPKMQIAHEPIQRKIKFNVGSCGTYQSELDFAPKHFNPVPSFPGCEIAQHLIFLSRFGFSVLVFFGGGEGDFLHHCHCKRNPFQEDIITLTSGVTSITLCTSSQQSCFSGFRPTRSIYGLSTVAISGLILAKDVTLDCSKACICFVH